MSNFLETIKMRAKAQKKTIVLPETWDRRTLDAAAAVLAEGIADVILVGSKETICQSAPDLDLSKATFADPENFEGMDEFVATLVELRKNKGVDEAKAAKLLKNPLYFGVMMVKKGQADGMVAGAVTATPDVLRPALQILKTRPGTKLVSAFFVMVVPDCEYGANGTFILSLIHIFCAHA